MMEQTPDNARQHPAGENLPLSVGTALREGRERMGLAVEDVVNRLKFAPRQIRALEEDSFDQLPEGAFLRGFVRSYARLLQIDEAPLLAALPDARAREEAAPAAQPSVEVPFPGVYSMRKSNIAWLAAALLVALALGLFTWLHSRKPVVRQLHPAPHAAPQMAPLPAVAPVSAVPAAPAPAAPADTGQTAAPAAARQADVLPTVSPPKVKFHMSAAGAGPIRMVFSADSWVEARDKDGNLLMSQINTAGSEQNIDGTPPFTLTIGHASGVRLYYKGKQIDLAPLTNAEVAHVTLE